MKEHNKVVIQALNDYLRIDKPSYGILIKGDWGSGKSYFIKRWKQGIEDKLKNKNEESEDEVVHLKPIYVSLNGICSANQIDEALKRAISPFLHGKFMKGLGKALKLAAGLALRVNVDLIGDEEHEQLVCTVDPKALLEFDHNKVKGQRILIFDDIERAKLPIDEVLGYINYYIEHVGCHVIMIGDVEKVRDKDAYKTIKEKTIGHEYQVVPETEEALSAFVTDVDEGDKYGLADKKGLISNCFNISRVNNLRILRQSLYDYKVYVSHLPKDITEAEAFRCIKEYLLANFIIVYAEYKSGKLLMESFNDHLVAENCSITAARHTDQESPKETPAIDIQKKYDAARLTETHRVLSRGYVEIVMNYLLGGVINDEFLLGEVKRDKSSPWEVLSNYRVLNNSEFKDNLDQTAIILQKGDFESMDAMLMATCVMLMVIKRGMTKKYSIEKVLGWCTKHINEKYFPSCKTLEDLYGMRTHAHHCMSYYQGESILEECQELNLHIEDAFKRFSSNVSDKLTSILNTLSDEKIATLYGVYSEAIPDHSVTYSMHPIFSQVEPAKFVRGFVKLSNYSKAEFIQFVKYHYHQAFCPTNARDFVHYYEADSSNLQEIVRLLLDAAKHKRLVDKENIMSLAEALKESYETMNKLIRERDEVIVKES